MIAEKGIFFADTPSEGFSAPVFGTCRPNGWLEKNPIREGHLKKGDLTYVPHNNKTFTLPLSCSLLT